MEVILNMVGTVIVIGSFLFGVMCGVVICKKQNGKKQKEWVEENCCYLCQEKYHDEFIDIQDIDI